MFAQKDYDTCHFYLRRKAYDQAIIYFKDVIAQYPNAPKARDAYVGLAEAYRKINYREELAETCAAARQRYPTDREVGASCAGVPPAAPPATPAQQTP
jgi:outer membrane protein assembly factor BamD (BamD/ComL family)